VLATENLLPASVTESAASLPLSASQLGAGSNTLTAVYSGNTIAVGCCSASSPPGGGTQVTNYPSAISAPIEITCGSNAGKRGLDPRQVRSNVRGRSLRNRPIAAC
jgi:hypothetical protein